MKSISRKQVERRIANDTQFALVEVLPAERYAAGHLPGAMNVPLNDSFEHNVEQSLPDENQHVVVYCSSFDCPASSEAARRLETLGYRNVFDYEAGKADWQAAGLKLVSSE